LASEASNPGPVYRCQVIRVLSTPVVPEVLVVMVQPEFVKEGNHPVETYTYIMLARRTGDEPLLAVTEWPAHVYVLLPKEGINPLTVASLDSDSYQNWAWGEIYQMSDLRRLQKLHQKLRDRGVEWREPRSP
jgi:hypothetical protein